MDDERDAASATFITAAESFRDVVARIAPDAWEQAALGVWSVRDLVGHTSRALSTVRAYLGKEPSASRLGSPVAYFLAVRPALADPGAVARRGKETGAALDEDPAGAVATLVREVIDVVSGSVAGATVTTPVGTMTLSDYLPTRTFELAVHTLDLARALGIPAPASLRPAVTASCELAGRLASQLPAAPEFLLALTGRTTFGQHLSVV